MLYGTSHQTLLARQEHLEDLPEAATTLMLM